MCRPAFAALDRDWSALVRSPAAAEALDRWSPEPALQAEDLEDLVTRVWAASKADADCAHAALAARAGSDQMAARVLLQMLRPGLRSLGRRLALGAAFDDVDHEVLGLAWEQIRTYPIRRRPASIAANILLDVRKRYVRGVLETPATPLGDLPVDCAPTAPSAEHEAIDAIGPSLRRAHGVLEAAVDRGAISRTSAAVVWRTRVQQHDDAEVAADLGVGVRTLQRRRQRAERELATAC